MTPSPVWADLYAPASYRKASPEQIAAVTNGCGPAGWLSDIIPDHLLGLSILEPCKIHDWMWHEGLTHDDMILGNRVFLYNMLRTVDSVTEWRWLRVGRRWFAYRYYGAVERYGGPAFWRGKNKPAEIYSVQV